MAILILGSSIKKINNHYMPKLNLEVVQLGLYPSKNSFIEHLVMHSYFQMYRAQDGSKYYASL